MPQFCAGCGTQVQDGVAFCPSCGKPTAHAANPGYASPNPVPMANPPVVTSAAGMTDNVAGMLAYFTIIPAILFLVMEPYNRKPFVRFHAFQSLFFCLVWIAVWMASVMIATAMLFSGMYWFFWPLRMVLGLGFFIVWILLVLKANQGQMWKLPIIGDIAEKQARAGQ
jgi:uncharacterized membrane protein